MTNLEQLDNQIQALIRSQRNSEDISSYNAALILKASMLIIALLVLFILEGYNYMMLLSVAVLLILFMTYRIRVSAAAKALDKINIDGLQDSPEPESILKKIDYLNAGLNVKRARVKSVTQFYTFTTPLFLVMMKEILHGPQSSRFVFWAMIITLIFSFFIWRAFFITDNDNLDLVKIKADRIADEVNKL